MINMASVINKKIVRICNISKEFGIGYGIKAGMYNLFNFDNKYISLVLNKLSYLYKDRIDSICINENKKINHKPIVWSFWWQGKDSLPPILKVCLASHEKYIKASGVDYIFIDQNNIEKYITIPEHIKKKLNDGVISFTHFSDYLRIALVEKYGGMWIDITLLLSREIDKSIFDYSFYSFHLDSRIKQPEGIGQKITECKWAGFMLGSCEANNPIFTYMKESLEIYWDKYNCDIDYFLLNFLFRLAYDNNEYVRKTMDDVPINNSYLYHLSPLMNEKWNENIWNIINKKETFYKLTQKIPVYEIQEGEKTFYGKIKDMY